MPDKDSRSNIAHRYYKRIPAEFKKLIRIKRTRLHKPKSKNTLKHNVNRMIKI